MILVFSALVLMACFSSTLASNDAYWHLKTGQYIWQNHRLTVPDPFAFTTDLSNVAYPGEEKRLYFNLTQEWLAQVCFYLLYAGAGFPGVILFRATLLAAACALVGLVAWRRSRRFYLSLATTFAAVTIAKEFAADRPHIITFLLLVVTVTILEYGRWLWLLPPLFVVWANCHGGFFIGWVVLGIYCTEAGFACWKGKPVDNKRTLWTVTAASVLLSGLNPNGFGIIRILLYYRESTLQTSLGEWRRTPLWPPTAFVVMLLAAAAALLIARTKARLVDWLLFAVFAAAGVYILRNTIFLAFVGPLAIASNFPWKSPRLPLAAEFAAAVLILASGTLRVAEGKAFQLYAFDAVRPSGAAEFILAHHITGPMFNTYEQGGYLIWRLWPQERVFIDGRALNESAFNAYRRITYMRTTGKGFWTTTAFR